MSIRAIFIHLFFLFLTKKNCHVVGIIMPRARLIMIVYNLVPLFIILIQFSLPKMIGVSDTTHKLS